MSRLNPTQTIIIPPETTPWKVPDGAPPEPAVIAVTGVGPVRQAWVDSSQPVLRRV